jgi:hypothetical protein
MVSNQSFTEVLNQVENINTILDTGATTSVTVITGVSLVTGYLRFTTTTLNFTGGLITSTAAGSNIDIATATCT